jgi:hypothetical protein
MTRDELRDRITIMLFNHGGLYISARDTADQIIALFDGYKSPEQCKAEFQIEFDAWAKEEWDKRKQEFFDKLGKEAWDDDIERFFGKKEEQSPEELNTHTCSYYPLGSEIEKCTCGKVRTMVKGR